MKEIKAYGREQMVESVIDALTECRGATTVAAVSLTESRQAPDNGHLESVAMTKLELDVADAYVEAVVECIVRHACTGAGHPGDGKVFVSELSRAVRIEDGAEGDTAVTELGRHHP